jgi:aminopeptidase N
MSKSNGPANCHRNHWRRHDPARQAVMRRELERVLTTPGLSKNTYEMVSKSVA